MFIVRAYTSNMDFADVTNYITKLNYLYFYFKKFYSR